MKNHEIASKLLGKDLSAKQLGAINDQVMKILNSPEALGYVDDLSEMVAEKHPSDVRGEQFLRDLVILGMILGIAHSTAPDVVKMRGAIIARKPHHCWACGEEIEKGKPYWMTRYQREITQCLRETCENCTRKEAVAGNEPS